MVLEKAKVSNRQLTLTLMLSVVLSTSVLYVPSITASAAGRDGWISVLVLSSLYGLLVALVILKLVRRFPDKTIIDYAPLILGTILGKLLGGLYVLVFIHICSAVVREFGDFLLSAFMPETPIIVFIMVLLILAAWCAKSGIEVICRTNDFIFIMFILSVIAILIFVIKDADFANLLPVMENGIKPVIKGALTPSAWRGEIFILLMLYPYIDYQEKTAGYLYMAVILMTLILLPATAITTAVFDNITPYLDFPFFSLARIISISNFFQRIEGIILIMWVAGVTVKVAAFYYISALGTAQLLGLDDFKPVALPLGLIIAALSVGLFNNSVEETTWLSEIFPFYACLFELVFPLLLVIIAFLRKKGQGNHDMEV